MEELKKYAAPGKGKQKDPNINVHPFSTVEVRFFLQAKGATRKLGELAHFGQGIGFALQNATKMDCDGLTLWSDWGRRQGPGKSP